MKDTRDELYTWCRQLQDVHLPRWEELPDFELYMDQVQELMNRYIAIFQHDKSIITPSMVNNYVKLKMIPKPVKKRYNRIHIAYLIAITLLKQVLSIQEVKEGIEYQAKISGLKQAYNLFCEEMEAAVQSISSQVISKGDTKFELAGMKPDNCAIKLAALSFSSKLIAEEFVHLQKLESNNEEEPYEQQ